MKRQFYLKSLMMTLWNTIQDHPQDEASEGNQVKWKLSLRHLRISDTTFPPKYESESSIFK